jgi:hypothetical protein
VRLIPVHCDSTVNLYDWYVCVRGNRVEQLWPITARGAVYWRFSAGDPERGLLGEQRGRGGHWLERDLGEGHSEVEPADGERDRADAGARQDADEIGLPVGADFPQDRGELGAHRRDANA